MNKILHVTFFDAEKKKVQEKHCGAHIPSAWTQTVKGIQQI